MTPALDNYLETALAAADLARHITGRYFRTHLEVDNKADLSPVTIADRETEAAMRDLILDRHPDHGIFGEEGGNQTRGQRFRWILDPIDGTKSFATGRATFGTLIALLDEETPLLGIIDQGILDERWIGVHGRGTTFNGRACRTREERTLSRCSIYATTLDMFDEETLPRHRRLAESCQFRIWGGDCYSYGLLAAGFTDLVCEADLFPYDYLALVPVVEGAGGIITDWDGNRLTLESGDQVLASANRALHETALAMLAS